MCTGVALVKIKGFHKIVKALILVVAGAGFVLNIALQCSFHCARSVFAALTGVLPPASRL